MQRSHPEGLCIPGVGPCAPAQIGFDPCQKNRCLERLDQIIIPAHVQRPDDRLVIAQTADENDGAEHGFSQFLAQAQSILVGQHDVHQDQVIVPQPGQHPGFLAAVRDRNIVIRLFEEIKLQNFADLQIILH